MALTIQKRILKNYCITKAEMVDFGGVILCNLVETERRFQFVHCVHHEGGHEGIVDCQLIFGVLWLSR